MNRVGKNKNGMAIIRFACCDANTPARMDEHWKVIHAYCVVHGIVILPENVIRIIESGMGDSKKRPRFFAALERARVSGIRHIVFYSHDRMERGISEDSIEDMLRADQIRIHFAKEHTYLRKDNYGSKFFSTIRKTIKKYRRLYRTTERGVN